MRGLALFTLALCLAVMATAGVEIPDTPEAVAPLEVGDRAPVVTLRDVDGKPVPLDAHVGKGPIALVFYRGGW
ncbi:MAG: hypothetical protein QNK04_14320 [Myxococcota bacterium]|nr:hypothetical protein [Myxococcota bacterium]